MSLIFATVRWTSRPLSIKLRHPEHLTSKRLTLSRSARRWQSQHGQSHSNRIHILGTGNIGSFIAHSMRLLPSAPPVSLLFHRPSLLEAWKAKAEMIEVMWEGVSRVADGFDIELITPSTSGTNDPPNSEGPLQPIDNLIITVKAPMTVTALRAIQSRVTPESTLLFLQNGMGVIDEVNTLIFPSPPARPHYLTGIITHGINSTTPFTLTHAGLGTLSLGPVSPDSRIPSFPPNHPTSYLLRTLLRAPNLNAMTHSNSELLQLQWEKLVVNAIINPLTALSNTPNGSILTPSLAPTIQLLVGEISTVIQALPEMPAEMKSRFLPERLEKLVRSMAEATARNLSSMLQDVRAGRKTEVEYITGYIVRRAEEVGVRCEENRRLTEAVLGVEGRGRR